MRNEDNQKFLGVTYDKRLTFGKHVEDVSRRMTSRNNLLSRLTGTSWGWRKEEVRKVYTLLHSNTTERGRVC